MLSELDPIIEALSPGARIVETRALTGGVSAQVVAVSFVRPDGGTDQVVVRRRPSPAAWGERRSIDLEHELMTALHASGIPVPRPRGLFGDALVMDFVPGSTEPPEGAEPVMAELLARIHAQHRSFLDSLPPREDPIPTLRQLVPEAPTLELAPPDEPTLLHGDFWPGNLLWRGGEIVAVLDWEDAAVGDPASDLASARLELEIAAGAEASAAFTDHYLRATDLDPRRLPVWDLYVSATALEYMDQWGLRPDVLEKRRAATRKFRDRALHRIADVGE